MTDLKNLEKVREECYNCSICGQCVQGPVDPYRPNPHFSEYMPIHTCPMRDENRFLTRSAAGMNTIARGLLEGTVEVTDELVDAIYDCILCDHCETNCGEVFHLVKTMVGADVGRGVKTPEVVRALRADLVELGKGPTEKYAKTADLVQSSHNRFGLDQGKRAAWLPDDMELPEKAPLVFFVGCIGSFRERQTAIHMARILKAANVEFTILGEEEWCCGGPQLLNAGYKDAFKQEAEHNAEAIRATGAAEVVTACADCYRTLKVDYPEAVGDLGFEVIHSSELFARLLKEEKIKFTTPVNACATYQDPCQLSRVCGISDEPRQVIESIPGITLKEMQGNREYTVCCGHYPLESPDISKRASKNRLEDAKETGADMMITACSFCQQNFRGAVKGEDSFIHVVELTDLVAQAMGIE